MDSVGVETASASPDVSWVVASQSLSESLEAETVDSEEPLDVSADDFAALALELLGVSVSEEGSGHLALDVSQLVSVGSSWNALHPFSADATLDAVTATAAETAIAQELIRDNKLTCRF